MPLQALQILWITRLKLTHWKRLAMTSATAIAVGLPAARCPVSGGQNRKCPRRQGTSVAPPIVLQNSFWTTEDKFSGLWARPSNIVRGTTETRDELTGNFGSALEDTLISDYRLIALFAKKC